MASQLIYTSAPRLLEAGRTGFGTVARHRAVSGLLVAAVERVSQFGRAPGQNPRRVVLSHRIIHAGTGSYHVFSCIRDAGSDYTGRTNHLAHHLIAEAHEARAAAEAGLTPTDILQQMDWRRAWAESPRFFEPDEEISLSRFRPKWSIGAWQKITGNPAHPHLASQSQRCLLIMPSEEEALALFSESLSGLANLSAWLVTFSTHVEPGDDLTDLRWVALAADSPWRSQVESSSRTTFDLTDPAKLPTPRLPEIKASPNAVIPVTSWPDIPTKNLHEKRADVPLPPLFHESKARKMSSPSPYIVAAALIALMGISSFFILPRLPLWFASQATKAETAISLAQTIDAVWQKHRLHLPETKSWLKAEADPALVDAHQETLNQILAAIRDPLRPAEITLPTRAQNDFIDLITSFRAWQKAVQQGVNDPQWTREDPQELQAAARATIRRINEVWGKVNFAIRGITKMPDIVATEIHSKVLNHLTGSYAPSQGTPNQWQELLELTNPPGNPSVRWIHAWQGIAQPASLRTSIHHEDLQEVANLAETPAWLRQKIQKQVQALPAERLSTPADQINRMLPDPPIAEPTFSADSPSSPHLRFIAIESSQTPLAQAIEQLSTLPIEPDMRVFIGSVEQSESSLTRLRQLGAAGVYRRSFNDPLTLEFHQRRLIKIPDPKAPTRILARPNKGSHALFEIIILPKTTVPIDAWPRTMAFTFQTELHGRQTLLDLKASAWLSTLIVSGNPSFHLQDVNDPSRRYRLHVEGSRYQIEADLSITSDSRSKVKLSFIDQELETLRQGIRIDEQRLRSLETSNLARAQKEEQAQRLDDSLAMRQQRLLQLEEDRKALVVGTPQFLGLPKGSYSLLAGLRRLCELSLEASP